MATGLPPQAKRLRADLAELTGLAFNDLGIVWRDLDTADAARDALRDILPRLVEVYGAAAATLAADWYDDLRTEQGVGRRFSAIVAAPPAKLGTDALAGYGIGPLFQAKPDWDSALSLVQGGLQRRVANMSRETITGSSISDPSSQGWQRVGSGECAFCALLIGRGAVYSEAGADFASHDHCDCSAVPAFDGLSRPVKAYTPGPRHGNKDDYDRAREYIATH